MTDLNALFLPDSARDAYERHHGAERVPRWIWLLCKAVLESAMADLRLVANDNPEARRRRQRELDWFTSRQATHQFAFGTVCEVLGLDAGAGAGEGAEGRGRCQAMMKAEQETVIRWDRDEQAVHIWTADPTVWRKLAKLGVAVREETSHKGEVTGRFYVPIPLARFRFGLKRERTAAQKAAARVAAVRLRKPQKVLDADGENAMS